MIASYYLSSVLSSYPVYGFIFFLFVLKKLVICTIYIGLYSLLFFNRLIDSPLYDGRLLVT